MTTIRTLIARAAMLLLAFTVAACGSKGGPADAPTDVALVAGDGQVTVSWTPQDGVEYWIFYAPDSTITLANWTSISTARAKVGAVSPQVIEGLTNSAAYTFIVNGRTTGGKGGDGTAPLTATPRLAGNGFTSNLAVPTASLNGVVGANVTISTVVYKGLWAAGTGGTLWQTLDGTSWTSVASPVTADLNAITFGNNSWYAVGNAGTVVGSVNTPASWTAFTPVTGERLNGVAVINGNVAAVGDNGAIVFGSGGSSYSLATSPTTRTLRAVTSGLSGEAIAVGDGGTILRSADGLNWVARTSPTTADLYGVAWGNARYVAVGRGGVALTSTDGENWSTLASPVATDLLGIVFGSQFVAVGRGGQVVSTVDTTAWAVGSSGVSTDLLAVGWGLAQYTAVGTGGINVYSR